MTSLTSRAVALIAIAGGTLGLTCAAFAEPPAPPPAVYNWTGFYVGLHAGGGSGMTDWGGINFMPKGGVAGGQIGVNQQAGNLVFGIEADAAWSTIKGTRYENVTVPFSVFDFDATVASKNTALSTLAARFGFAAGRLLVYGKAGFGWADMTNLQYQRSTIQGLGSQPVMVQGNHLQTGSVLGFGAEYALLGNWSVKVEYDAFDFPRALMTERGTLTNFAGVTSNVSTTQIISQRLYVAKAGFNYRFGPDQPPMPAPAPPAPGHDWTGLYVGVEGAGAQQRVNWIGFQPFDAYHVTGGLGGAVVGVRAQAMMFVAGVEGEWMGGRLNGSRADPFVQPAGTTLQSLATRIDSLATATAQLGFLATDHWLFYGRAGAALAHANHTETSNFFAAPGGVSSFFFNQGDALHFGGVLGIGTEYAFLGGWSAKLEFDCIRFKQQQVFLPGTLSETSPVLGSGTTSLPTSAFLRSNDMSLVKAGLNYQFHP